ncbi:oxidoreductase [Flavobacterium sp.]|uniref:sialidase family protein n=1 Tax=Flavobacterium sp. TaxID=239 RepID=UPI00286B004D|nr:oxidoreductase [Flavobacterium sp.]
MKITLVSLLCLLSACAVKNKHATTDFFQSVTVDTLLKEKINSRAIIPTADKVYYAGGNGIFGFVNYADKKKTQVNIDVSKNPMEFRSIAKTSNAIFVLSIGNPAQLYKYSNDLIEKKLVYKETHDKAFYDSMQFWNENEGIAIGDPIADCFSIIITRDGGNSWRKSTCENLPKVIDGEAAFAASNSNIIIKENDTWIVSGGKKARVFYSSDKGNHWQVFETPMVQGLEMTGIYTADFYNSKIGVIAGGNYEKQNDNFSNKAMTFDGGKTWKLVGENQGFGYASCMQFVPESNGSALVCVAGNGLYYSHDFGATWTMLLETKELYTLRFLNKNTAIAAGRSGVFKINFN